VKWFIFDGEFCKPGQQKTKKKKRELIKQTFAQTFLSILFSK
jgi:hypothetical protein